MQDQEKENPNLPIIVSEISEPITTEMKIVCSLVYLWGILFFLPLILYKQNVWARKHANQGFVLLLLSFVGTTVFRFLAFGILAWIVHFISFLYTSALLILGIIGIISIWSKKKREIPIISKIHILK